MRKELAQILAAERKKEREIAELRQLRVRTAQLKNPDKKLLDMIDDEIKQLENTSEKLPVTGQ